MREIRGTGGGSTAQLDGRATGIAPNSLGFFCFVLDPSGENRLPFFLLVIWTKLELASAC